MTDGQTARRAALVEASGPASSSCQMHYWLPRMAGTVTLSLASSPG